jgi:hypothetical protein
LNHFDLKIISKLCNEDWLDKVFDKETDVYYQEVYDLLKKANESLDNEFNRFLKIQTEQVVKN